MRKAFLGIALVASLLTAAAATDASRASGLAGLHEHVAVGNKICMGDHFHYGHTAGWKTRALAEQSAVRSWSWFTEVEYGGDWADYRHAEQASMDCGESDDGRGGTVWSCNSKGIPCKLAGPGGPRLGLHPQPHARVRPAHPRHGSRRVIEAPVAVHPYHRQHTRPRADDRGLVWPGDAR